MERPLGVTILAVVALISGALGVLKGLVALGLGGVAASWMATSYPVAGAVVGVLAVTYGVVALVLACFSLGFGFGAWNLKSWAWTLGVGTEVATLVWACLIAIGPGTLRGQLWTIVLAGAILYYLTRPDIKSAFGRV